MLTAGDRAHGLYTIDESATLAATGTRVRTEGEESVGAFNLLGQMTLDSVDIATGGNFSDGTVADNASTSTFTAGSVATSGASAYGLVSITGSTLTATRVAISTEGTGGIGASAQFGSTLSLNGGTITTSGAGAAGLFSVGLRSIGAGGGPDPTAKVLLEDAPVSVVGATGSSITAAGLAIATSGMNAHGASVRGGSSLALADSTIDTRGPGAAALFRQRTTRAPASLM